MCAKVIMPPNALTVQIQNRNSGNFGGDNFPVDNKNNTAVVSFAVTDKPPALLVKRPSKSILKGGDVKQEVPVRGGVSFPDTVAPATSRYTISIHLIQGTNLLTRVLDKLSDDETCFCSVGVQGDKREYSRAMRPDQDGIWSWNSRFNFHLTTNKDIISIKVFNNCEMEMQGMLHQFSFPASFFQGDSFSDHKQKLPNGGTIDLSIKCRRSPKSKKEPSQARIGSPDKKRLTPPRGFSQDDQQNVKPNLKRTLSPGLEVFRTIARSSSDSAVARPTIHTQQPDIKQQEANNAQRKSNFWKLMRRTTTDPTDVDDRGAVVSQSRDPIIRTPQQGEREHQQATTTAVADKRKAIRRVIVSLSPRQQQQQQSPDDRPKRNSDGGKEKKRQNNSERKNKNSKKGKKSRERSESDPDKRKPSRNSGTHKPKNDKHKPKNDKQQHPPRD